MPKICLLFFFFSLYIISCDTNNPTNSEESEETEEIKANASTIDLSTDKQIIRGFGAANIVGWRPDMTEQDIYQGIGTEEGQLGFSILRLRIPPQEDQFYQNVSTAEKAYSMGAKIVASPWSPPAEMKTNNDLVGGKLREDSYEEYAAHLAAFNDVMESNGPPLYAISIQNEPDIEVNYESCDWSPSEMVRFVKNHTSTIGTRIMVPESFQFRRPISDAILNDAEAAANLDIIAGHIYGGGLEFYPLAEDKGKEVWMTEHYTTSDQSANLWPAALEVGNEIHQVRNANMNAYIWWYLVRYYGPIGEGEEDTSKGEITKRGYVMSQFSRFIRPGFHRKEATSNPQSDIFVSAYQGDDKTVIVAINMGNVPKEQQFVFKNSEETIGDVVPYLTSSSSNVEQQQAIKVSEEYSSFTFDLPSQSIVTFVTE